jgi:hypothetical protein
MVFDSPSLRDARLLVLGLEGCVRKVGKFAVAGVSMM